MLGSIRIRPARIEDCRPIRDLYIEVASNPGGLARLEYEISDQYVSSFLDNSLEKGICLVAERDDGFLCGEIHAYSAGIYCFSHVLGDLTIAVHPSAQGAGLGRMLFGDLMERVERMDEIVRVELIARESNHRAIGFYESLGFIKEGVFRSRIKNLDGSLESDIPMAWTRV